MLSSRRSAAGDDGSIMVLIIGYMAMATVLIVIGVDVSKVFLAQRALAAAADAAALSATDGVDTPAIYGGDGPRCGRPLPVDPVAAARLADSQVAADRPDLDHTFVSLGSPSTSVGGGDVEVSLTGEVAVPFGRVVGWLDPSRPDGLLTVTETSHAASPVIGAGC